MSDFLMNYFTYVVVTKSRLIRHPRGNFHIRYLDDIQILTVLGLHRLFLAHTGEL